MVFRIDMIFSSREDFASFQFEIFPSRDIYELRFLSTSIYFHGLRFFPSGDFLQSWDFIPVEILSQLRSFRVKILPSSYFSELRSSRVSIFSEVRSFQIKIFPSWDVPEFHASLEHVLSCLAALGHLAPRGFYLSLIFRLCHYDEHFCSDRPSRFDRSKM